jgi:YHS domain-containing protein
MVVALFRLILFAVIAYVAMLFVRIYRGLKRLRTPPQTQPPPEVRGVMVKDEVCGIYIPREEALTEFRNGVEHYFCSEECRRKGLKR